MEKGTGFFLKRRLAEKYVEEICRVYYGWQYRMSKKRTLKSINLRFERFWLQYL